MCWRGEQRSGVLGDGLGPVGTTSAAASRSAPDERPDGAEPDSRPEVAGDAEDKLSRELRRGDLRCSVAVRVSPERECARPDRRCRLFCLARSIAACPLAESDGSAGAPSLPRVPPVGIAGAVSTDGADGLHPACVEPSAVTRALAPGGDGGPCPFDAGSPSCDVFNHGRY